MLLFSRMVTAASLWVHILAINLYAARTAYLQGKARPAFLSRCLGTRKCLCKIVHIPAHSADRATAICGAIDQHSWPETNT